jgi:hypothetical protein
MELHPLQHHRSAFKAFGMNATSSDESRLRGMKVSSVGQPNEIFSLQDFAPRIVERSSAPDGMNKEALEPISVQGRYVERVQ